MTKLNAMPYSSVVFNDRRNLRLHSRDGLRRVHLCRVGAVVGHVMPGLWWQLVESGE